MIETWVPFERHYSISSDGRLRNDLSGRIIKPVYDKKGYVRYRLMSAKRTIKLHRVTAMAFIPNPDNLPQVNHINGIRSDNRVENLEWVTNLQNSLHAKISILNESQVLEIRAVKFGGPIKRKDLAIMYGVSEHCIKDVRRRRSWSHI